ncbi:MAG: 5'-methylthioadenosine/adenosylhomocysteine nucleosidase [Eubacteriaceae bacterium]|jgi:adenosylhomocysteine nucleosidase|nr:5'-methylthioadenosine/adenosylhomocysteine nucleosidase [Eubacteriaceae bacterium]
MIGIIAALEGEVSAIKKQMTDSTQQNHAGLIFNKGLLQGAPVVVVRCGVGKVNAAMCTQILVDLYRVDGIINIGVAGGVAEDIRIGDVVISSDSVQYDMDATAFGHPRGEIPNMQRTFFPADTEFIALAEKTAREMGFAVRVGRIMTADLGVNCPDLKKELCNTFDGVCVEMEGAAIAQVAYLNRIPHLIVRAISDNADGDLMEDYSQNFKRAVTNATAMVVQMVSVMAQNN